MAVEKLPSAKLAKTTFSISWAFCIPQILAVWEEEGLDMTVDLTAHSGCRIVLRN